MGCAPWGVAKKENQPKIIHFSMIYHAYHVGVQSANIGVGVWDSRDASVANSHPVQVATHWRSTAVVNSDLGIRWEIPLGRPIETKQKRKRHDFSKRVTKITFC